MNFLTNLNLNGNELQNVVIQNVATDPSNGKKGQLWFNTTEGVFKYIDKDSTIKIIGNGTLTENDIAELREAVSELDSVINSEETGFSSVVEKINTMEGAIGTAQTTAEAAQSAAEAAQTAVNNKVEKVNGVEDNIILFGANGTIKDSGKKLSDLEMGEINTSDLISKVESAKAGNIAVLTEDGSIDDGGFAIQTVVNDYDNSSIEIPTSRAIISYLDEQLSGITQGVVFRGVINSTTGITVPYNVGDMYYVGEAGEYYGFNCEAGDVLIAKVAKSETETAAIEDWSVLESNKDVFVGASDELAGTSGFVPAPEAGALRYLDSTGAWSAPVATRWTGKNGVLTARDDGTAIWTIRHSLNRLDVQVIVYEVDAGTGYYTQVIAEVVLVSPGICQVIFNTSTDIDAEKYFVVVM